METLRDVLIEQLKDLYSAETQLVEALPNVIKGCKNSELKKAFQSHLNETKTQVQRLGKIALLLDEDLEGHTCKAMQGLVKEASETLKEEYANSALKDVMIVASAQRIEHYEIAGYGNAIALAEELELEEVLQLLQETIDEEGNADKDLTDICVRQLFDACNTNSELSARDESRI